MEWTVHTNYGTDNEIVESLEFDDDDKEDDFNFDSLLIASFSNISHYNINIKSSITISRIFIN